MDGIRSLSYTQVEKATKPLSPRINAGQLELHVISKGIQVYKIGDTEYSCHGNDLLVIPPNTPYSTGSHPQYKHSFYSLLLSCDDHAPLLGLDQQSTDELRQYLRSLQGGRYPADSILTDMLRDALRHYHSNISSEKQRCRGELLCCLYSLEDILKKGAPEPMPNVAVAYQYINENITEDFSLSHLAKLSRCSIPYFKEQFAQQYGITPLYYILWRKIAHAKRMIVLEDRSVAEIAAMLNFTTPAYFSSVFKKYTSRTPSEYKQMVKLELQKQRHVSEAPQPIQI